MLYHQLGQLGYMDEYFSMLAGDTIDKKERVNECRKSNIEYSASVKSISVILEHLCSSMCLGQKSPMFVPHLLRQNIYYTNLSFTYLATLNPHTEQPDFVFKIFAIYYTRKVEHL